MVKVVKEWPVKKLLFVLVLLFYIKEEPLPRLVFSIIGKFAFNIITIREFRAGRLNDQRLALNWRVDF